jgi:hypothetical protein
MRSESLFYFKINPLSTMSKCTYDGTVTLQRFAQPHSLSLARFRILPGTVLRSRMEPPPKRSRTTSEDEPIPAALMASCQTATSVADPAYWSSLCPRLTVLGSSETCSGVADGNAAYTSSDVAAALELMEREGYFTTAPAPASSSNNVAAASLPWNGVDLDVVADAILRLKRAGECRADARMEKRLRWGVGTRFGEQSARGGGGYCPLSELPYLV